MSDRGQSFIELGGADWGDWFDPDVWRGCLEDEPVPHEPRALERPAQWLIGSLNRLAEAAVRGDDDALRACLAERRARCEGDAGSVSKSG